MILNYNKDNNTVENKDHSKWSLFSFIDRHFNCFFIYFVFSFFSWIFLSNILAVFIIMLSLIPILSYYTLLSVVKRGSQGSGSQCSVYLKKTRLTYFLVVIVPFIIPVAYFLKEYFYINKGFYLIISYSTHLLILIDIVLIIFINKLKMNIDIIYNAQNPNSKLYNDTLMVGTYHKHPILSGMNTMYDLSTCQFYLNHGDISVLPTNVIIQNTAYSFMEFIQNFESIYANRTVSSLSNDEILVLTIFSY